MASTDTPNAAEPIELVITSEEQAWEALKLATSRKGLPDGLRLRFDGWPTFQLDIKGKDWNSTVPSRVMAPLLDVQRDLHRAYASVRYHDFNLRRIKEDERDELEVILKVEKGSSIFSADLWKQFNQLATVAVERMNGTETVITVLGLALAIAAPVMFKAWLKSRHEDKKLDTSVQLSAQETRRLEVFAKAVASRPEIQTIQADVQATNNRLLKAVKPGDSVSIHGQHLRSDEVEVIVQPERDRARDVHLEGPFVVLGNRTDKSDGFRITVRRLSDQLQLSADVPIELLASQREKIQKAEWSKKPIWLAITASALRNTITAALVTSASDDEEDLDPVQSVTIGLDVT